MCNHDVEENLKTREVHTTYKAKKQNGFGDELSRVINIKLAVIFHNFSASRKCSTYYHIQFGIR